MASFLNIFFFVFHTVWLLFNCVGWIWHKTRRVHLVTIGITAISWFGLGYWYGWGYCICTDWHWQVRRELGYFDPPSYTQLLITEITGIAVPGPVADYLTAGGFIVATILSIILNIRDRRKP